MGQALSGETETVAAWPLPLMLLALESLDDARPIDGQAPADPDMVPRMPEPLPLSPEIQQGSTGESGGRSGNR